MSLLLIIIFLIALGLLLYFALNPKSGAAPVNDSHLKNALEKVNDAKYEVERHEEEFYKKIETVFGAGMVEDIKGGKIWADMPSSFLRLGWADPDKIEATPKTSVTKWLYHPFKNNNGHKTSVLIQSNKVAHWEEV